MNVGYYKDDMIEICADSVNEAAELYAEDEHQIDEESDMHFQLYVEDDNGKLFLVTMFTEYDPRYKVDGNAIEVKT